MYSNTKVITLYITTGLSTGGAEIMLYQILTKIDRERFSPVVISLMGKGTCGDRIEALDIPVYSVNMDAGKPTFKSLKNLLSLVKKVKPDIIQGWMYHGNLAGQIASIFSFFRIPIVWSIHHSIRSLESEKSMTIKIIKLGAYLSHFVNKVAFVSQASKSQHEALGYSKKNTCVIPNGFDTNVFIPSPKSKLAVRKELGINEDTFLIGMICRFHPMKDHGNFLKGASLLLKQYPDTHFLLAGTNVDLANDYLTQLMQELNLSHQIHLLGERTDIPRLTSALDVLTVASAYGEAFPLVVGEAMSCAIPCVVTDIGDSGWIVGEAGRVIPPKDAEALANAWQELIEIGVDERENLGKMARTRISESFSLDYVVKQYESMYETVLSQKKSTKRKKP